jgi:N-methylhydantoinase B/oxoprolinase/acetone carboxylase alpha subunit
VTDVDPEELAEEAVILGVDAAGEPLVRAEPESAHAEELGPAELQVLVSRLTGIADEMGLVLRRAAFSPNIKERADCSAALFAADGELLVQAEHIPVHVGSMPASVAAAIDAFGDEIEPGEQIVLNDPFAGGTHLNDITVVAPCHVDDELVGWVANRAHHADLGGATPGSIPPDALEIQQEGLRLPPVRLSRDVREVIVASSRMPEERRGDLDAQWGANVVGRERLAAEAGRPWHEVVAYGERRMRAALADLPDGEWDFTDVLDSTGPRPEQNAAATICVCVRVAGDEITFDFTGTDEQRPGNVNAVEAVTRSAVAYALRAAVVPDLEGVGGSMRPVTVVAPAGTLVAAVPPVAVGAGNVEVSQRIADVCLGALAQVVPGRVAAASQGTMNNVLVGGEGWVYYETVGGGQGARPDRPGMSGVHTGMTNTVHEGHQSGGGRDGQSGIQTGMTNTQNTPTEALERAYPLRVRRYRLRTGSGGAGRYRGGDGIERDLEVLEDVTVSLITERRLFPPWGLAGGGPGAVGENWLLPGGDKDRAQRLGDKCSFELKTGDVLRILTPGGGGWGSADDADEGSPSDR